MKSTVLYATSFTALIHPMHDIMQPFSYCIKPSAASTEVSYTYVYVIHYRLSLNYYQLITHTLACTAGSYTLLHIT